MKMSIRGGWRVVVTGGMLLLRPARVSGGSGG